MAYEVFNGLDKAKAYNVISIVSEQSAIPNVLFIKALKDNNFNIEQCFFIYGKHKPKKNEILKEFYNKENCYSVEPYNLENNIKNIKGIIDNQTNKNFIFNITGGTKIMSCALFDVAKETNMSNNVFYIYDNKIYKTEESGFSIIEDNSLTTKDYIDILDINNKDFEQIEYSDFNYKFIEEIKEEGTNEKKVCFTHHNKLYLICYDKDFSKHKDSRGKNIGSIKYISNTVYDINLIKKKAGPFSKAIIITEKDTYKELKKDEQIIIDARLKSSNIQLIPNNENINSYDIIKNIIEKEIEIKTIEQQEENIYSYKPNIIVSLVGEQSIPNILFIKHILKQNQGQFSFLFIYTEKTESVKENITNFFKNNENKTYALKITNPADFTIIKKAILDEINKIETRLENNYNILFNITGGTTIMSCALFDVAKQISKQKGTKDNIYYIDKNKIYSSTTEDGEKIDDNLLDIKEYFKAVLPENEYPEYVNDNYVIQYQNINCILEKIFSFRQTNNLSSPKSKNNFEESINNSDVDLTRISDSFFEGEWLEIYMYFNIMLNIMKKENKNIENNEDRKYFAKNKIKRNISLKLKFEDNKFNEIDICFIDKNILYLIECKTNISGNEQSAKEKIDNFINKLKYLQIKLGLLTKAILVIAEPRNDLKQYIKDKTKDNGIDYIMPLRKYTEDLYKKIIEL